MARITNTFQNGDNSLSGFNNGAFNGKKVAKSKKAGPTKVICKWSFEGQGKLTTEQKSIYEDFPNKRRFLQTKIQNIIKKGDIVRDLKIQAAHKSILYQVPLPNQFGRNKKYSEMIFHKL